MLSNSYLRTYDHGRLFGIAERMLRRMAALAASAVAATVLGSGAAVAQTPPPTPPVAPAQPAAQEPTVRFKSAVDLVSVTAVVRDKKGRFVSDLSRDDFTVIEGGERRPIIGFNQEANGPVRVAVLFDISGSMRVGTKSVDAKQAARHIFSSLQAGDEAAMFAFDTQLEKVAGFTRDFKGLESKVDNDRAAVWADVALRRHRRDGQGRRGNGDERRQAAATHRHRRHHRRHRYEEPADGAGSLGDRQQHRHPGLHHGRDVAGGRSA